MRKVCTTLRPRVKQWDFTLYESPDAAYYLRMSSEKIDDYDDTYSHRFSLKKNEVVVIEWLGTEYIYDDEKSAKLGQPLSLQHEAYEFIRMIKFPTNDKEKISEMSPYIFVEAHHGWVLKGTISWDNINNPNKKTINLPNIPDVDFTKIFKEPIESKEEGKKLPPSILV